MPAIAGISKKKAGHDCPAYKTLSDYAALIRPTTKSVAKRHHLNWLNLTLPTKRLYHRLDKLRQLQTHQREVAVELLCRIFDVLVLLGLDGIGETQAFDAEVVGDDKLDPLLPAQCQLGDLFARFQVPLDLFGMGVLTTAANDRPVLVAIL